MFNLQRDICKPVLKPEYDIQNLDSTFSVASTENAIQTTVEVIPLRT
jgi:hypothetical protein